MMKPSGRRATSEVPSFVLLDLMTTANLASKQRLTFQTLFAQHDNGVSKLVLDCFKPRPIKTNKIAESAQHCTLVSGL